VKASERSVAMSVCAYAFVILINSVSDRYITHMLEVQGLGDVSMIIKHEGLVLVSLVYSCPFTVGNPLGRGMERERLILTPKCVCVYT